MPASSSSSLSPPPLGLHKTAPPSATPSSLLFLLLLHQNSLLRPSSLSHPPSSSPFSSHPALLSSPPCRCLSPSPSLLLPPSFSIFASSINHQMPWPSSPTSPPIVAIELNSHPKGQIFSSAFPRIPRGREANFMKNHPNLFLDITSFFLQEIIKPSTTPDSNFITSTRTLHPASSSPWFETNSASSTNAATHANKTHANKFEHKILNLLPLQYCYIHFSTPSLSLLSL